MIAESSGLGWFPLDGPRVATAPTSTLDAMAFERITLDGSGWRPGRQGRRRRRRQAQARPSTVDVAHCGSRAGGTAAATRGRDNALYSALDGATVAPLAHVCNDVSRSSPGRAGVHTCSTVNQAPLG